MRKKQFFVEGKKVIIVFVAAIAVFFLVFQSGFAWNIASRFMVRGADFSVACSEEMEEPVYGGPARYVRVLAGKKDTVVVQALQGEMLLYADGCIESQNTGEAKKRWKVSGENAYTFAWTAPEKQISDNTYFLITVSQAGLIKGRSVVRFTGKQGEGDAQWCGKGEVLYQQDYGV